MARAHSPRYCAIIYSIGYWIPNEWRRIPSSYNGEYMGYLPSPPHKEDIYICLCRVYVISYRVAPSCVPRGPHLRLWTFLWQSLPARSQSNLSRYYKAFCECATHPIPAGSSERQWRIEWHLSWSRSGVGRKGTDPACGDKRTRKTYIRPRLFQCKLWRETCWMKADEVDITKWDLLDYPRN